jgi:D-xylose transport system substrate-binding protein
MTKPGWRAIVPIVAIMAGAAMLAACGNDETGDTSASGDCVVGISWNNFNEPRWAKADQPKIKEALAAHGCSVVERDANDSAEQQLTDVSSLIAEGVDALIILAKDTKGILPAVQEAKDAGIPVIGYDRLIPDDYAFYLSFNNVGVGTVMAEQLTAVLQDGNIAIVKGHSGDPNATFLRNGMTPILDEFPGLNIVCEDFNDDWDPENARNMMTACLAANNNDIQGVISENDNMAGGVVSALDEVGLAGTVPVTGQDGDLAALNRVALGTQLVSVWKDSNELGTVGGEVAYLLATGTPLDEISFTGTLGSHTGLDSTAATEFDSIFPDGTPGPKVWSLILKPTPVKVGDLHIPIDAGWFPKADICAGADTSFATDCA